MPRGKYKIAKARKQIKCSECQYHTIEVGKYYLYGACPPEHEVNQSGKWLVIKACLRCVVNHNMHTSETRKQLEKIANERK